jgi:hypothetical protein
LSAVGLKGATSALVCVTKPVSVIRDLVGLKAVTDPLDTDVGTRAIETIRAGAELGGCQVLTTVLRITDVDGARVVVFARPVPRDIHATFTCLTAVVGAGDTVITGVCWSRLADPVVTDIGVAA